MYRLDRMRKQYEALTAADGYIIGFAQNGDVYGAYLDKIPRRFTKVQKECSSAGFLECLVTDSLGKNNFCTNAVCDPHCKKIVEITKM